MKKFDANKFLQIIKSKNSKDQYDNYIPNILDKVFDWKKNLRNKYMCPKNFGSLHKYFKKIDKKMKYETIFNAYDDLSAQKEGKWFFELGIISHQTNKKILFACVYSYATKYDEPTFDIEKKYKLKKYPDKMKMMNMIYDYLDGDIYFPKTIADELHRDDSGVPINGSWGSVLNFSYKLELKPQKTVFHPLYYYSHPHRQRIEKSFLSYPHTKINYEFGKKRK
tara:strand:- start:49 stop:717 length:669 start_codon:yes stop_codon:yes gene_type:complete